MPALCHHSLQALEIPEVTGSHSRVQGGLAWDSGSSPSPSPDFCPCHSSTIRVSLDQCLEPSSTVWMPPEPCVGS